MENLKKLILSPKIKNSFSKVIEILEKLVEEYEEIKRVENLKSKTLSYEISPKTTDQVVWVSLEQKQLRVFFNQDSNISGYSSLVKKDQLNNNYLEINEQFNDWKILEKLVKETLRLFFGFCSS